MSEDTSKLKATPSTMRAKLKVTKAETFKSEDDKPQSLRLTLAAVGKPEGYTGDGSDEDNTFARYTPNADLSMTINNPDLLDKFEEGQVFYVDFTPVE